MPQILPGSSFTQCISKLFKEPRAETVYFYLLRHSLHYQETFTFSNWLCVILLDFAAQTKHHNETTLLVGQWLISRKAKLVTNKDLGGPFMMRSKWTSLNISKHGFLVWWGEVAWEGEALYGERKGSGWGSTSEQIWTGPESHVVACGYVDRHTDWKHYLYATSLAGRQQQTENLDCNRYYVEISCNQLCGKLQFCQHIADYLFYEVICGRVASFAIRMLPVVNILDRLHIPKQATNFFNWKGGKKGNYNRLNKTFDKFNLWFKTSRTVEIFTVAWWLFKNKQLCH